MEHYDLQVAVVAERSVRVDIGLIIIKATLIYCYSLSQLPMENISCFP